MDCIETSRLVLRPFMDGDGPLLYSVVGNDPDMTWDHSVRPVEMVTRTAADRRKHFDAHGFGVWAVLEKDTGEMIGQTGLQVLTGTADIELVTYTAKRKWRQGFAAESCKASLFYGFTKLAAEKIFAVVRQEDKVASGLIRKLGFRHLRDDEIYETQVDVSVLLRSEWTVASGAIFRIFPFDEQAWHRDAMRAAKAVIEDAKS